MGFDYDVAVVGGGPAGSTAARVCARAGLKTLLIEKERFPRYKPCAGCLSIKAVHWLGLDVSSVVENVARGARFTYALKDPFSIQSNQPIAFMVMRDRFDQFLMKKALAMGADVLEETKVIRVEERNNGVEVTFTKGEKVRCEYLIGADGAGSVVAQSLLSSKLRSPGDGIGLECKVPFESTGGFPEEDLRVLHFDFGGVPHGYGWVFPKGKWLSIGMGGIFKKGMKLSPRQHFDALVKGLNFIEKGRAGKVLGRPVPFFYSQRQKVSLGKVLLVGDAAHLVDPLTGEGMSYALRSGMLAAEAILQSKTNGTDVSEHYQRQVKDLLFEDLKWALTLSRFIYRFTKLAYRTLKRYPELGDVYVQVLEGKVSYQGFAASVKERVSDLLKGRPNEKSKRATAGV